MFVVNLLINYVLLKACCVFVTLRQNKLRIITGAIIGAIYAVLIFFPDFSVLYTTIAKFLVSMLIIAVSFPFYSVKSYIKAMLVFYFVSIGFGGCVLCIFYLSDIGAKLGAVYSNGIFYFNLPWTILLASGLIFILFTKVFNFISSRNLTSKNLKKKIYISYNNKTAELTALLDTGNSLLDPLTLSPVIIAEYKAIKNLFSEDIRNRLELSEKTDAVWAMQEIVEKGFPVRIIPYSSIGKENGMILGFTPDQVELHDESGLKILKKCVIGIYNKPLSKDRSYTALLNPYL